MTEMFPDTGQLRLAKLATTSLVPFDVDTTATSWALLVAVIGPNCAPLRGRAPDIELRAGSGLITPVPQDPGTVTITDETGTEVATASWTRDPTDVFTVRLDISNPDDRHWAIRLTNNDPEELGFVWSSAETIEDARRPRIVMDTTPLHRTVAVGEASADISIPIANIGTGPLDIVGQGDQDMGAGYILRNFPTSLAPNACDHLQIGVTAAAVPPRTAEQTATFVLDCNDPVAQEITLQLSRNEKGKEHKDHKDTEKDEHKDSKDHKDRKEDKDDKDGFKEHPPERSASPAGQPPEHFIPPAQRPDLTDSALRDEPPEPGKAEG